MIAGSGHAHTTLLIRSRGFVDWGACDPVLGLALHLYSGMGPGLLAGTYRLQDIRFHVRKTIRARGAEFIADKVAGVDGKARQFYLQSGRAVG